MRFGLEAWVRGETGGGERKYGKGGGGSIFDMLCVFGKKRLLGPAFGMLFVGFCIGVVFGS